MAASEMISYGGSEAILPQYIDLFHEINQNQRLTGTYSLNPQSKITLDAGAGSEG